MLQVQQVVDVGALREEREACPGVLGKEGHQDRGVGCQGVQGKGSTLFSVDTVEVSKQKAPGVSVVKRLLRPWLRKGGQMQEDVITVRLRLAGLRGLETRETGRGIEVGGQDEGGEGICPGCGGPPGQ